MTKRKQTRQLTLAIRHEAAKCLTQVRFHDFDGEAEDAKDFLFKIYKDTMTEEQALDMVVKECGYLCSKVGIKVLDE